MLKAKRKNHSLMSVLDELQKQREEMEKQERAIKAQREREIQEEYERERERRIKELKEEQEQQEMKRKEKIEKEQAEQEMRERKLKEGQREVDEGLLMEKEDRQGQAWEEAKKNRIKDLKSGGCGGDGEEKTPDESVKESPGNVSEGTENEQLKDHDSHPPQAKEDKDTDKESCSKGLDLESLARQVQEREETLSLPKSEIQEEKKSDTSVEKKKAKKKKKEEDPAYEWQDRKKKKGGGCVLL
jgi:hypothetical protein